VTNVKGNVSAGKNALNAAFDWQSSTKCEGAKAHFAGGEGSKQGSFSGRGDF